MKNIINYYYDLYPELIVKSKNITKFQYNDYYYFIEVDDISNLKHVYETSLKLKNNNIYCHEIILNRFGNIVTNVNNKFLVMLKSKFKDNLRIKFDDIMNYSYITSNIQMNKRNSWYELWSNKIDYLENQINQNGRKYPLLRESFSYFLGLVENGISLYINNDFSDSILSVCHSRINSEDTLMDLYNPLNFVIDYRVRDFAEYFKSELKNRDPYLDIINYLNSGLTYGEMILFFIRLLYPSFYFDDFDLILKGEMDEEKIKKSIELIDLYESLLKRVYRYIKGYINTFNIEWLN